MKLLGRIPGFTPLALFLFAGVYSLEATTFTVTNTNQDGAGSLRNAVQSATNGDTINFSNTTAGGATNFYDGTQHFITYTSEDPNGGGAALDMPQSITIIGPGTMTDTHGNVLYRLTVRRDMSPNTPWFRLIFISPFNSSPVVSISGLALTGGITPASGITGNSGGAILNNFSVLTLSDVSISLNQASNGGGIANVGGTITLSDCVVGQNYVSTTNGNGAGIFNYGQSRTATMTIRHSIISNNSATTGCYGGGISNNSGEGTANLTIANSELDYNDADTNGGALFNGGDNATATVSSCTFYRNNAKLGGAIVNFLGSLKVTNSTFGRNSATGEAAAISNANGKNGGATSVSRLEVTNCTFNDNSSPRGSCVSTDVSGGKIATTTLGNNIFNTGTGTAPNLFNTGSVTSQGYNLSSDNGAGLLSATGDLINTDPMLGSFANNYGLTPTYEPLPGSPAINGGSNALIPPDTLDLDGDGDTSEPLPYDQRGPGFPRVQVNRVDIGSVEVVFTPVASTVVTTTVDEDNGTSDPSFGTGTSLREAINRANSDGINTVITFSPTVFAAPRKTITLNGTALPQINLDGTLSITAPSAGVEISGNNQSRVFLVGQNANVTLTGLTVRNGHVNTSGIDVSAVGGGILNFATLLLDSCSIINNVAARGGGVYSDTNLTATPLTMRNCTVSGNTATQIGGGLYNVAGRTALDSCTITANTAPTAAGSGLASYGDSATRTEVRNSIVAGNANTDVDLVNGGVNSLVSNGYNLIGDGNDSAEFVEAGDQVVGNGNTGLLALAENGGRTPTHALLVTSPAVNKGNTGLTSDQRGIARPQAGTEDKGAYEFNSFTESLLVTTLVDEDDRTSDPNFGTGTSLREAINRANSDGVNSAITFSSTVFAQPRKTITLNGTALPELIANGTLSITAPAAGLEISGNDQSRVFLVNTGANVTLTGLTIRNGTGAVFIGINAGGGILNSGTLLLDACTLSGNNALTGAAIYSSTDLSGNTLTLRNCTISGNDAADFGGALFNAAGLTLIDSSTIAGNTAPAGAGSGLASSGNANCRTEIRNSIIAGNANTDVDLVNGNTNSLQSNGYNLVGDGNGSAEFMETGDQVIGNGAFGLAPLADNGGRTQTRALQSGSPAINTGNTSLTSDQRGVARPQGTFDDKGAFEFNSFVESLTVNTTVDEDNGTSDPAFGAGTSLREAIAYANSNPDASTIIFNLGTSRRIIDLAAIGDNGSGASAFLLSNTITIQGPGANLLTVRRASGGDYRIFRIPTGATATISGLTISNGNLPADFGGGILNRGSLTLQACALTGNHAQLGGGILSSGALNVTSSTISGNSAEQGGGLYSQTNLTGLTTTIRNSTISGNTASDVGGGLYNFIGLAVVESSTITNNSGPAGRGGGVANSGFGTNILRTELRNSIIAANASSDIDFIGATNQFQSNGFNLIGNGNATGEFVEAGDQAGVSNPKLGLLANNGGPTLTHALQLGSPAINTGGASGLTSDQRGLLRGFGSAVDKGAYELQPESYAFWSSYIFPTNTPANLLAADADADGDGIPNGLEQVLGSNPNARNALASLLQFEIQGNYLVLQFARSIYVDPAKVFAEQSLTLQPQSWTSIGITYDDMGPAGATTELIQALIPIDGAPKKFGRLRYSP